MLSGLIVMCYLFTCFSTCYNEKGDKDSKVTKIGDTLFHWGERTFLMGIINLSPESFSGDGLETAEEALERAQNLVEDGADIIDVGGESTRPEAKPITSEEEMRRVIPFITRAKRVLKVPISIDTYKVSVAEKALAAGADLLNDVSGLTNNSSKMLELAGESMVPIVITSNQRGNLARDIMNSVLHQLTEMIVKAEQVGVSWENIIVDPGVGFGKTVEQNLEILRRLDELKILRRPILLGTSRKSFIGAVLGTTPENRLEGTAATITIGIMKGADIVRVHDVKQMRLIAKMSDAVMRGWEGKWR